MADLDDIKEGKDFGLDRPQQNTLYTLKGCGSSLCGGSCGMTRHSPLFENIYEWTIFRKED